MNHIRSTPTLQICPDAAALAAAAADLIADAAQRAVSERGRFIWVVSGGTTPAAAYARLAEPGRVAAPTWSQTFVFFGDERWLRPDDPRSNFRMVHDALLARVPIPLDHVFRVPTEGRSAAADATAYAGVLAGFFSAGAGAALPRSDLVLLGLGEDGHTASLFPHAAALLVRDAWVTWTPPGATPPPVDRITLTYPALNAARQVAFLVAGERKARALRDVLERRVGRDECPAAGVRPVDGTVTWLVDEAAARRLRADA